MVFRKLSLLLVMFLSNFVFGQTTKIELDHNRFSVSNSIEEDDGENILFLNSILPASIFGQEVKTSNITSISKDRKVNFSIDYEYPVRTIPSIIKNYEKGLLQASFINSNLKNKHLMRLDEKGKVIWSKTYGSSNDTDPNNNGYSDIEVLQNGSILLGGGAARNATSSGNNDFYLGQITKDGRQTWGKRYCFSCENNQSVFRSIAKAQEGIFLIGGIFIGGGFNEDLLIIKVNDTGNKIWAKRISNSNFEIFSKLEAVEVLEKPNGNILVLANEVRFNQNSGSYLVELDNVGNLIKTTEIRVNQNLNYTLTSNSIFFNGDNIVISAGIVQDSVPNQSKELNVLYSLDSNGNILWKHNYFDEILEGFGTNTSSAIKLKSGLIANMTNNAIGFDKLYPILLITDAKGENGCENFINISSNNNQTLSSFNFDFEIKDVNGEENYSVNTKPYSPVFKASNTFDIIADTTICDDAIALDATAENVESYVWNTGPNIEIKKAGTYVVTFKNKSSCLLLSDTIVVKQNSLCDTVVIIEPNIGNKVILPNIFSPNGDNVHDEFFPIPYNYETIDLYIYSPWGELVFTGNATNDFKWDGNFNGEPLEQGVYVYLLKYRQDGTTKTKSGDVTLIR